MYTPVGPRGVEAPVIVGACAAGARWRSGHPDRANTELRTHWSMMVTLSASAWTPAVAITHPTLRPAGLRRDRLRIMGNDRTTAA